MSSGSRYRAAPTFGQLSISNLTSLNVNSCPCIRAPPISACCYLKSSHAYRLQDRVILYSLFTLRKHRSSEVFFKWTDYRYLVMRKYPNSSLWFAMIIYIVCSLKEMLALHGERGFLRVNRLYQCVSTECRQAGNARRLALPHIPRNSQWCCCDPQTADRGGAWRWCMHLVVALLASGASQLAASLHIHPAAYSSPDNRPGNPTTLVFNHPTSTPASTWYSTLEIVTPVFIPRSGQMESNLDIDIWMLEFVVFCLSVCKLSLF